MTKHETQLAYMMANAIPLLTAKQADDHGLLITAKSLRRRRLLDCRSLVFRPLRPTGGPLAVYRPGDAFDYEDALALAQRAQRRMREIASQSVTVFQANSRTYSIWGDKARKKGNPFCFGHDHLIAEVFLSLDADERARWRSEDVPITGAVKFEKVPDAAIVTSEGQTLRYHEAVGSYPAMRLLSLVRHAEEKLSAAGGEGSISTRGIFFW